MFKTYIIAGSALSVQEAINDFIKDKDVVDIKFQSVLLANGLINDRALIIYREEK